MNTRKYRLGFALLFAAALSSTLTSQPAQGGELNAEQQQTILREANTLYKQGVDNSADRALSQEAYEAAAAKYQTLVDDGVNNWKMYFNLGNAYLQSNHLGPAIVNYERAAALTSNNTVHANLQHAKSLVKMEKPVAEPQTTLEMAQQRLDAISLQSLLSIAVISWALFWVAMSVGRPNWQRRAKTVGVLAAGVFLAATIIMAARDPYSQHPSGIITSDQVVLREGNGTAFNTKSGMPLPEGVEVQILEQRGEWYNIQLENGQTGWLSDADVDVI